MYRLTILSEFAAAHNLRNYNGECEKLHGHNWKVEVSITANELDSIGIALDFKILKQRTLDVLKGFDHVHLNEIPPFDTQNPSSENLAQYIFKELSKVSNNENIRVSMVKVWESERAAATYYED
ncbi:MAG: 6-carboxytetrahydropterin synthase QueD [Deltaproteobacteria bacterium]|nr:6-carboxytetrahydropterin synthase QueD [Deltaproteobacteria bacterium]